MFDKKWLFFLFYIISSYLHAEELTDAFLKKYPLTYQDICIQNQIIASGTDICDERLHLIRPVLDQYKRPVAVLDIGAAQGYFAFNIAYNYPDSCCVMIDTNTDYYPNHGDMLLELCQLNKGLRNIYYLNKKLTLEDFSFLNSQEHFDLVLAFLVIHQIEDSLNKQIKLTQELLKLGDNVIIEVANDVNIPLASYIEYLSSKFDCTDLGEVRRHKDPNCPCSGRLFWFKTKEIDHSEKRNYKIKNSTFLNMNGLYPKG